ncbi:MAG: hypothetical protein GY754_18125 [bacterium]|nr:hypothetical protein [bacterium]
MKKKNLKKYTIVGIITALAILSVFYFTGNIMPGDKNVYAQGLSRGDIRDQFEKERDKIRRGPKEVKRLMNKTIKDIKDRNLKFRVELNEMMKYKIAEITGAEPPRNLEREAKVQFSFGNRKWDQFFGKYKRYFKKKKKSNYRERERKRKELAARERRLAEDRRRNEERRRRAERQKRLEDERKQQEEAKRLAAEKKRLVEEAKKLADEKSKLRQEDSTDIFNSPTPTLAAFNWRDSKRTTPVRQQGICGSCWAFTTMAVFEANYLIRNHKSVDFSEQFILDCAKDRRGRKAGTCGGGWYGGAFDYLQKKDAVTEAKIPYKKRDSFCRPSIGRKKKKIRVAAWGYVDRRGGIPSVRAMKKALCKYGPLAACVKVTPAFQAYRSGIFDEHARVTSSRDINHAITIVGWDDNKKSYLVKNSWGTRWGDKGYVWVEYGCNNIGFGAAWLVVDSDKF